MPSSMRIKLHSVCLTLAAVFFPVCQSAKAQPVVQSGADHALLERFAESTIIAYQEQQDVNYRLVLGNMRRTAGRVVAEDSERLRGDLTRITYEIPQGYSSADVMAFYKSQSDDKGYLELFSCNGRDCGNSNYWANEVFEDRLLYGPERNQFYLALQTGSDDNPQSYAVVYVIARANRRLLAHIEVLDLVADNSDYAPNIPFTALLRTGALIVPNLSFDSQDRLVDAESLDQLAGFLQANPSLQLFVVAHLRDQGGFEVLMERSLRRAEQVRAGLVARGVSRSRLVAQGVGPLAPLCLDSDCSERVELVVRP